MPGTGRMLDVVDEGEETPDGQHTLWHRVVGDMDRIGWWTLPVFLAVGLAGAVMAGALAVVYYSQQVADLEAQTREGRQDLQAAVDEVDRAGDEALEAIQSEVEAVQDTLSRDLPVQDVGSLGLVLVEARVNAPPPPSATVQPDPPPAGDGNADGAPDVLAQQDQGDQEGQEGQQGQPSPTPTPTPPPEPPPVRPRLGVGFAVAVEDGAAFIATSFDLVADEGSRAGVVEEVVVTTMDSDRASGVVHSWDEDRGIALLRVGVGELEIGDWRPRTDEMAPGDRVTVVGITPDLDPVQLDGAVGQATVDALVTSLPVAEFLRGAPVVDRTGRVVAVYTPGYRPFGEAAGEGQAMAPVGLFCERMLDGCESLEAEATDAPVDDDTG